MQTRQHADPDKCRSAKPLRAELSCPLLGSVATCWLWLSAFKGFHGRLHSPGLQHCSHCLTAGDAAVPKKSLSHFGCAHERHFSSEGACDTGLRPRGPDVVGILHKPRPGHQLIRLGGAAGAVLVGQQGHLTLVNGVQQGREHRPSCAQLIPAVWAVGGSHNAHPLPRVTCMRQDKGQVSPACGQHGSLLRVGTVNQQGPSSSISHAGAHCAWPMACSRGGNTAQAARSSSLQGESVELLGTRPAKTIGSFPSKYVCLLLCSHLLDGEDASEAQHPVQLGCQQVVAHLQLQALA